MNENVDHLHLKRPYVSSTGPIAGQEPIMKLTIRKSRSYFADDLGRFIDTKSRNGIWPFFVLNQWNCENVQYLLAGGPDSAEV
jgi:hypothetical protein